MTKIMYDRLAEKEQKNIETILRSALLTPKKREDMAELFCNILTASERIMLVRRLQVAKYLLLGKSYGEIREKLGVGWDLIRTVHRWLSLKLVAYRTVIPELLAEEQERTKGKKKISKITQRSYDHLSFTGIRRRFPAAYLLINMLIDNEW